MKLDQWDLIIQKELILYNDGTKKELLLLNGNIGLIMIDKQVYKLSNISSNLENEILEIYEANK